MKLKSTLLIVCALFLTNNVFTQDVPDWVFKTPMTKVYPTGEYYNLPAAIPPFWGWYATSKYCQMS